MYIELKTGYQDNGPAWIGRVKFSKTGQTIYFIKPLRKEALTIMGITEIPKPEKPIGFQA
jgi:hypothetical protein